MNEAVIETAAEPLENAELLEVEQQRAALENERAEFEAERTRYQCELYLRENCMPMDFMNIFPTADPKAFEKSVNAAIFAVLGDLSNNGLIMQGIDYEHTIHRKQVPHDYAEDSKIKTVTAPFRLPLKHSPKNR